MFILFHLISKYTFKHKIYNFFIRTRRPDIALPDSILRSKYVI